VGRWTGSPLCGAPRTHPLAKACRRYVLDVSNLGSGSCRVITSEPRKEFPASTCLTEGSVRSDGATLAPCSSPASSPGCSGRARRRSRPPLEQIAKIATAELKSPVGSRTRTSSPAPRPAAGRARAADGAGASRGVSQSGVGAGGAAVGREWRRWVVTQFDLWSELSTASSDWLRSHYGGSLLTYRRPLTLALRDAPSR
jgi:hypothetical protein